jgi:RNA polymerase sigma-70 factor (ECF subfamily)
MAAINSKPAAGNKELKAEELLGRVADGDLEALATVYDRFAPTLMGLLLCIMPAKPAAESVLQEVFSRLWQEAAEIAETKGSLAAWLVLTARHAALQRLRAQRKVAAQSSLTPQGPIRAKEEKPAGKSTAATLRADKPGKRRSSMPEAERLSFLNVSPQVWLPRPEDIALVDARLALLQRAFNQIPKQQRGPLELTVFGGYTESEIAEQLAEPLGKVKAALRAAFTFMRHRQHAVLGTWTADI